MTRRMIGKVDPVNPGRMFPNEMYFQLFPENEVPEEVREEFLRGCEIKRRMQEIRRSPEEIIEGVVNGLSELRAGGRNVGDGSVVPHSWNEQNRPLVPFVERAEPSLFRSLCSVSLFREQVGLF